MGPTIWEVPGPAGTNAYEFDIDWEAVEDAISRDAVARDIGQRPTPEECLRLDLLAISEFLRR